MTFHEVFTPLMRVGFKGRDAASWLADIGLPAPARPNSCSRLGEGGWCLRLGYGEYVLAHDRDPAAFEALLTLPRPARVHPVLRSDHCVRLHGPDATDRLLQLCDVDERRLLDEPHSLALLMAAGVPVVLHTDGSDDVGPRWRLWCDPTYVAHLDRSFSRTSSTLPRLP